MGYKMRICTDEENSAGVNNFIQNKVMYKIIQGDFNIIIYNSYWMYDLLITAAG